MTSHDSAERPPAESLRERCIEALADAGYDEGDQADALIPLIAAAQREADVAALTGRFFDYGNRDSREHACQFLRDLPLITGEAP